MPRKLARIAGSIFTVAVLANCADGEEPETGRFDNPAALGSLQSQCVASAPDAGDGGAVPACQPPDADGEDATDDEAPPVEVEEDPEPEPPPSASCEFPAACKGATSMGSLSGDEGNSFKSREGTTSQWLTIRVNEGSTGFSGFARGKAMKIRATLAVPAGTNYDLYMYMVNNSTAANCTALKRKSTAGEGKAETMSHVWGETGTWADNKNNSATIRFEVRHISGPCSKDKKWKLTVYGNR